jgi:hypothetical protein
MFYTYKKYIGILFFNPGKLKEEPLNCLRLNHLYNAQSAEPFAQGFFGLSE